MWTCPKCGREFKRTNQDHYCGKSPESVEVYIELQVPEARGHLLALRDLILCCVPGVTERIAWSMPMYKKDKYSVCFAACKKHVSLYLDDVVLEHFNLQLNGFMIKKNALYLPYDRELPINVLKAIIGEFFDVQDVMKNMGEMSLFSFGYEK